jgi:hypothetical protein
MEANGVRLDPYIYPELIQAFKDTTDTFGQPDRWGLPTTANHALAT